jgi:predicted RNA-binding protein
MSGTGRQKEGTKRKNKSGDREVIYRQKRLKNWLRRRHRRKIQGCKVEQKR